MSTYTYRQLYTVEEKSTVTETGTYKCMATSNSWHTATGSSIPYKIIQKPFTLFKTLIFSSLSFNTSFVFCLREGGRKREKEAEKNPWDETFNFPTQLSVLTSTFPPLFLWKRRSKVSDSSCVMNSVKSINFRNFTPLSILCPMSSISQPLLYLSSNPLNML